MNKVSFLDRTEIGTGPFDFACKRSSTTSRVAVDDLKDSLHFTMIVGASLPLTNWENVPSGVTGAVLFSSVVACAGAASWVWEGAWIKRLAASAKFRLACCNSFLKWDTVFLSS